MLRGALQPLRRCDVRADIKAGCDLIPRNEAALAIEGGRARPEREEGVEPRKAAQMRGRGESKMSQ